MGRVPEMCAPAAVPDAARLAELVNSIRDGSPGATDEFCNVFYRGACFLARRRSGRSDVDTEVRALLQAVAVRVRNDKSLDGCDLTGLVRRTLIERFPAETNDATAQNGVNQPAVSVATGILAALSPTERDALKRCYVQGQPPESFLENLRLTADQFRAIQTRARAEFSTKTHRTNVA